MEKDKIAKLRLEIIWQKGKAFILQDKNWKGLMIFSDTLTRMGVQMMNNYMLTGLERLVPQKIKSLKLAKSRASSFANIHKKRKSEPMKLFL